MVGLGIAFGGFLLVMLIFSGDIKETLMGFAVAILILIFVTIGVIVNMKLEESEITRNNLERDSLKKLDNTFSCPVCGRVND